MIFQSEREEENPFYQIYVLDLSSGDTTRVSPSVGKTTCGFFQISTDRVIFASATFSIRKTKLTFLSIKLSSLLLAVS